MLSFSFFILNSAAFGVSAVRSGRLALFQGLLSFRQPCRLVPVLCSAVSALQFLSLSLCLPFCFLASCLVGGQSEVPGSFSEVCVDFLSVPSCCLREPGRYHSFRVRRGGHRARSHSFVCQKVGVAPSQSYSSSGQVSSLQDVVQSDSVLSFLSSHAVLVLHCNSFPKEGYLDIC